MSSASMTASTPAVVAAGSSRASSPTGLYVPVHKRTGSSSSSSRSSSTTRSEASAPSERAACKLLPTTPPHAPPLTYLSLAPAPAATAHPLVYSRDALLGLMHSPLARLPLGTRESLRAAFPELVTNRRQRKALEYHTHIQSQVQVQVHAQPQPQPQPQAQRQARLQSKSFFPFVRVQPRRNRPAGRAPERRRNATKVVDEASWRGRRVVPVPIAV
ncbi:hypothetical protein BDZ94DRAFT_996735 [Collybia nuda]|uniref:Uncharacterized protein n=1 Tax=Collybia nuda TaxID=64659 RepID=A0A9P5Y1H1_9AGAR|nr:hypothetical protein BDZ94DRAFT_996735 [Collybia nuda]